MWGLYRHLRNASPAVGEIRKDGEQTQECLVDQGHISNPPRSPTLPAQGSSALQTAFLISPLPKAEVGVMRGDGAQGGIRLLHP